MSREVVYPPEDVIPDVEAIDVEGEKVLESIFPEKQYRLLAQALYDSWPGPGPGRTFQAFVGVGLFFERGRPGLCPDVMVALDTPGGDPNDRANRSYFIWERGGRAPDWVIEVVSDREGGEDEDKLRTYHAIGVRYYVIFDPRDRLGRGLLRSFARTDDEFIPLVSHFYPRLGLGLTFWRGEFQGMEANWLRWCDAGGRILPTGSERAQAEAQRADREAARAAALEARLRELGIEP
ncbi:MAG: Uma2 family endonuclease [Gemmataceae bacterium]